MKIKRIHICCCCITNVAQMVQCVTGSCLYIYGEAKRSFERIINVLNEVNRD